MASFISFVATLLGKALKLTHNWDASAAKLANNMLPVAKEPVASPASKQHPSFQVLDWKTPSQFSILLWLACMAGFCLICRSIGCELATGMFENQGRAALTSSCVVNAG